MPLCKYALQKDTDVLDFVPRITLFTCAFGLEH